MRRISASVVSGSVKWTTRLMKAVSNAASGKDVFWQSSTRKVTFGAAVLSRASASIPGDRSVAVTVSAFSASTDV